MRVSLGDSTIDVAQGDELTFGRGDDVHVTIALAPGDVSVSRRAGVFSFDEFAWRITNTGRRSFFLVSRGVERELTPGTPDTATTLVLSEHAWIRVPTGDGDVALVLRIPASERPPAHAVVASDRSDGTTPEGAVALTRNELRSVLAVYEGYLQLPPRYRREPNSFRAAAHRLSVEEGKVKADLRRVQEKVAVAGGPAQGGSRYRDALIVWLMSRNCVTPGDLPLLDR